MSKYGPIFFVNSDADVPNIRRGAPIPMPSENKAAPPIIKSLVKDMYIKAPISGAVTHGPIIRAESEPIIPTPI